MQEKRLCSAGGGEGGGDLTLIAMTYMCSFDKRQSTQNGTTHSKTRIELKTRQGGGGGSTVKAALGPTSMAEGHKVTPSVSPRRTRMYRKVTDTNLMRYSSED